MINEITRRALIAEKSRLQPKRPRCEECGSALVRRDFTSYWDGDVVLEREYAIPRICENCTEEMECESE